MSDGLDSRSYENLGNAIDLAQHTVYKRYLQNLKDYPLVSPTPVFLDESTDKCLRFFQLDEITYKKGEDIFQKLSTVYHACMSLGCNLSIVVDVSQIDAPVKIYIGVRNSGEDADARGRLVTSFRALKNGMMSNFPGTRFHDIPALKDMTALVEDIFGEHTKHISTVSSVASLRDKSKTENKNFIQGLERFIDAMRGNVYTAVFLAEPITAEEQSMIRSGYERLYSDLSSFSRSSWSYNENDSKSVMESLSEGISSSVTDGVSHTQSHTYNAGMNIGVSSNKSSSTGTTKSTTKQTTRPTILGSLDKIGTVASMIPQVLTVVKIVSSFVPGGAAVNAVTSLLAGSTKSNSVTEGITNTIGKAFGMNGGVNAGYARTSADTTTHAVTETNSKTKTEGTTESSGTGRTLQIENLNKPIIEMLERIEEQLDRTKEGEDYGSYSCGAYFLSGKQESALLAASTYRSLIIGEGSSVESGAINTWNGINSPEKVDVMKEYLKRFVHPVFAMPIFNEENDFQEIITYSAGTTVSGLELPLHLGIPTKSVHGLPVLEHVEFGRNVTEKTVFKKTDLRKINIGKIYHMGQIEKKVPVDLNVSALTAHTFITGSTGSGKSNTIYQILNKLNEEGVRFLVVEPAKGEYRDSEVFGERSDVTVFGTNPQISGIQMLRINPFSFPDGIHVLEHLDRLVEIFNVCWPMYAAMPAILKDAILRAYEVAGWDMEESINRIHPKLFPTFIDVYKQIRLVLEESEYSNDNKGDYTGSLVTRLRSLTNGINGLIFTPDEISSELLFDTNVIVDLSRVGSTETKSLIMGLLVLKLQEYRMNNGKNNQNLRHVTVLEEAHNLLKRTSTEQSSESSNLLGKSVEMLSNSIAEMRTYGEGFIIADQSPGLLDLSVIRNTNTKIIMRLPDYSDRELVGKAAGLNEEQIIEISKLDSGVAVIKQSDWLEAVLCRIEKYDPKDFSLETSIDYPKVERPINMKKLEETITEFILNKEIYRKLDRIDIHKYKDSVLKSKMDVKVKTSFIHFLSCEGEDRMVALRKFAYNFFHADEAISKSEKIVDMREWSKEVIEQLSPSVLSYPKEDLDLLLAMIILEKSERDARYVEILKRYTELYQENRRIL